MTSVGIFARVEICAGVITGQGISIETSPLMPVGSISAACSGKKPDSEWPIKTAPFSLTARAAMSIHVGLGFGSVEFRSGIICLYNSSTASIGNWPSGNAVPKVGPKRNTDHAVWWLAVRTFGNWLGGTVPALTAAMLDPSKPERAREAWSARYTARFLRTKYSFQPMRPSGVVSQVLLLRQHPCTMTTGTC